MINRTAREERDGRAVFVKTRDDPAAGEYATEAAGLRWLADAGARVPEVIEVAEDRLVLEWLEPSASADDEDLGRMLATLHASGAPAFGALPPGAASDLLVLGDARLPSAPAAEWPAFYAGSRLLPLLPQAGLSARGVQAVERVCERIGELAGPSEPPARLHGDLWSGNVLASGGRAHLIDPAAYGGHREVDLAMLMLFGSPSARLLAAYDEVLPRAGGHADRVGLYQLFPLLVHAVLFGGSYVAQAERTALRYAGSSTTTGIRRSV